MGCTWSWPQETQELHVQSARSERAVHPQSSPRGASACPREGAAETAQLRGPRQAGPVGPSPLQARAPRGQVLLGFLCCSC